MMPSSISHRSSVSSIASAANIHGHAGVPKKHSLSRWIGVQRREFKQKKIREDRLKRLNALGMIWNVRELQFFERLEELKLFVKENGHARPVFGTPEGNFVLSQRNWYNGKKLYNGKPRPYPPHRVPVLEALPGWAWNAFDA